MKRTMLIIAVICICLAIGFSAFGTAPGVTKTEDNRISTDTCSYSSSSYYLNGLSFQQDAIITYNGWQYVAFYSASRYIRMGRRQLPSGSWQLFNLTDYQQSTNDFHNVISMGISSDGVIHLAFDHHSVELNYRKTNNGVANNPSGYSWTSSLFGSVRNYLSGSSIPSVTYARFIPSNNGYLTFYYRSGTSGYGDGNLYEYSSSSGSWSNLGKFADGSVYDNNAYFHGFVYDSNNRLHTTYCWRATPDASTNSGLHYIYSDDRGRTWKNNSGSTVATTGSSYVRSNSNTQVWSISEGSGLINQEGMCVDEDRQVHVISRQDISGTNRQMHYWRGTNGTWHQENTGIAPLRWDNRSKIAFDSSENVYAIMTNLRIASASKASSYSDWAIVNNADQNRFHSEPLFDLGRLKSNGVLSIVYQESSGADIYCLTYSLNTGGATPTPTPTGGGFSGYYMLKARHSGKVADVYQQSTSNGANICQWSAWGGNNQQFEAIYVSGTYYKFKNRNSGKLMEIANASTSNGGNVEQYQDNGHYCQQWSVELVTGSYYRLINRNSGKAMDVSGASTDNGANILQWTYGGAYNQQWELVRP